jgi:N4-gp56 family major capsid protein|tara:strand:+ start:1017 stop:1958 length:942 start_codon:yes stop_codon:yes gene_type:complete
MALGTAHVTTTTAAKFIPELWSDEIVAAYKSNLVLANLVNRMPMTGKKGDTLHVPKPTRGSASVKAAQTQVSLIAATEAETVITVDKHYEYSRLIEDIVEAQALASMRKFYTDDAGYALAKQVDNDLFALTKSFGDGDGSDYTHSNSFYVDASNGLAAYAADTVAPTDIFTDLALRGAIQQLDDNETPMDGRFLVIPPSVRNTIMGIDRYQSSDFVDGRGVQNGKIGSLYGVDVYVSSNCPVIETAADNSASSVDTRGAILGHKDAMVLAEQLGVRSQTQYKQEYLANLFTSDTLYGTSVLRPESAILIAVPN